MVNSVISGSRCDVFTFIPNVAVVMLFIFLTNGIAAAQDGKGEKEKKDEAAEVDVVASNLNPVEGQPIPKTAFHNLAYSPDGKMLAAGMGTGDLLVWDLATNKLVTKFKAHDNWVFTIVFDKAGQRFATAGGDDLIKIWRLDNLKEPEVTLAGHTADVHSVAFSPDEKQLISGGDDKTPIVWDLETGKVLKKLAVHPRQIPALAISPDGKLLATASRDSRLRIFELSDATLFSEIDRFEKDVISVRFSPTGNLIAAGDYSGNAGVFDVDMGFVRNFQKCTEGSIVCVDFSSDGKLLAAVDDSQLYLISADEEKKPVTIKLDRLENEQFSFVRFHPTENKLAVTTTLARVLILDRATNKVDVLQANEKEGKESARKPDSK